MVHYLSFLETKYATQCTQLVEKYVVLNNMTVKLNTILEFSFPSVTFPSTFQLFLTFLGTGFEMFTVVRIHNVVWVRTLYNLVHGCECFGGEFWA